MSGAASLNFMEAFAIAKGFAGGPALPFLLAMSGAPDKLDVFLKAAGARRGRAVQVRTLPFNTFGQWLANASPEQEQEVILLFPWDFVPESDWRSGAPMRGLDETALHAFAQETAQRCARRRAARFLYVPAPVPPLFADPSATTRLLAWLSSLAADLGADFLPASAFSLTSYLSFGCPLASAQLGLVAEKAIDCAINAARNPAKVLVTDLDNVMWRGIIGEDGLEGIRFLPEGAGFRHFLYQTLLAKLKREGALLAAVSRNDEELAGAPFRTRRMVLHAEDFVIIAASYNAKSSLIKEISRQLNLGLDSFVFVDDNPIELEEVSASLPGIRCVPFPAHDDAFPAFLSEVAALFARTVVTAEDTERTEMYRRRLEGMVPDDAEGADLTGFLQGLQMALTIYDRSRGDRSRAVQLINKTNQFNLNGRRVTDDEVGAMLAEGGKLYTALLEDRTGSHGEVLSCLIDRAGTVQSLVMSCRVFQRRVEHAFFAWLGARDNPAIQLAFAATPRNEPIQQFLEDPAFGPKHDGTVSADLAAFAHRHAGDLGLFTVAEPG